MSRRCPWWVPVAILAATVVQLLLATFATGLAQFNGKAFGARLVAYPALMLLAPVVWWLVRRRPGAWDASAQVPWGAFALVMLPFLIDVTGNSLDLYDSVVWWDDLNHLLNWFFLCAGLGTLVCCRVSPRWVVLFLVTGLGALLAIGWELGEWYTFIRHGTELDTAYTDTLLDEALGAVGAFLAGIVVARAAVGRD
jgi:hypothetical protein